MFTGIVEGTAKIVSIEKKLHLCTHVIELPDYMLEKIDIGASLSCNGCCLTITKINGNRVTLDLIKETLELTNLSGLSANDHVNVERAAKFGDEIGGHIMSGHIVSTAKIIKITSLENNQQIWFKIKKPELMKYIFYKNYIGIDGISLTVGEIISDCFCVYLIPETLRRTMLGTKKIGKHVNLEIDSQIQATVDTVERFSRKYLKEKMYNI